MPTQVLIADDHPLTCEGLAMATRLAVPGANVHFAGSLGEAERRIAAQDRYDLILLDLMLPDVSGFSGLLRIQAADPSARVAVITARQEPSLAAQARDLGAIAFLRKSEPIDALAGHIRDIVGGESIFPPDLPDSKGTMRDRVMALTDAQRRVLFALADGRSNKQIAYDLGVTEATIKAHLTAIFRGLGVYNRAQALVALQPLIGALDSESN